VSYHTAPVAVASRYRTVVHPGDGLRCPEARADGPRTAPGWPGGEPAQVLASGQKPQVTPVPHRSFGRRGATGISLEAPGARGLGEPGPAQSPEFPTADPAQSPDLYRPRYQWMNAPCCRRYGPLLAGFFRRRPGVALRPDQAPRSGRVNPLPGYFPWRGPAVRLRLPHLGGSYVTRSSAGVAFDKPDGPCGLARLRRDGEGPPKLRVFPGECRVEGRRLMIICPYPFCNASWKSCPVLVQVAFGAARCERSA
jgi:hypothetical protein